MLQPGIPTRGKLEKKAVCSPCCGDGTTSYSDRAFGIIAQRSLQGNCFQAECAGRWIWYTMRQLSCVFQAGCAGRRKADGRRMRHIGTPSSCLVRDDVKKRTKILNRSCVENGGPGEDSYYLCLLKEKGNISLSTVKYKEQNRFFQIRNVTR